MKTKVAINYVLKRHNLTKYALAQELGCAPISVDQWLKRTKMSKAYAAIVYSKYGVVIDDAA